MCSTCDGSGVLQVADSVQDHKAGRTTSDWCHECPAGRAWKEAGLGG